ncbi:hypothetical protein Aple_073130 [Acrocarpospora pleiomorpha]|uniref:Uncharacterized protein n=1 Tax=Acrocarpospora pleiomorpha TaxID=90975 RepID=A0A5M3XSZ4_9ACTN|nr:hypothetical protein Aple_073130 [Acrocarpospora pleiomorpha]
MRVDQGASHGAQIGTAQLSFSAWDAQTPLLIGAAMAGSVDGVRVYQRPLISIGVADLVTQPEAVQEAASSIEAAFRVFPWSLGGSDLVREALSDHGGAQTVPMSSQRATARDFASTSRPQIGRNRRSNGVKGGGAPGIRTLNLRIKSW